MLDPAKPFSSRTMRGQSSAASTKADLRGLLDRARDERFRLLKMLKDARAEVEVTVNKNQPANPDSAVTAVGPRVIAAVESASQQPTHAATAEGDSSAFTPAQLQILITKLSVLDEQIDAKLSRVNAITDDKIARLEQVESRVMSATNQLSRMVADGRLVQRALTLAIDQADGLSTQMPQRLAALADAADRELKLQSQRLDETMAGLGDLYERQAEQVLAELRDRATALLDQMKSTPSKPADKPSSPGEDTDRLAA